MIEIKRHKYGSSSIWMETESKIIACNKSRLYKLLAPITQI